VGTVADKEVDRGTQFVETVGTVADKEVDRGTQFETMRGDVAVSGTKWYLIRSRSGQFLYEESA
jgi:hypothetical protein